MSGLITGLRICNIVVASADLLILFYSVRDWKHRSSGNRFLWSGLALLLAANVYGSAESLAQHVAGGARTALSAVALFYVLFGLIMKARGKWWEDTKEREAHAVHDQRLG